MPLQASPATRGSARRQDGSAPMAWTRDSAGLALATADCGPVRRHVLAEQVQDGWFWLAWTSGGASGCLQGMADTLDDAKAATEPAAARLAMRPHLSTQFGRQPE